MTFYSNKGGKNIHFVTRISSLQLQNLREKNWRKDDMKTFNITIDQTNHDPQTFVDLLNSQQLSGICRMGLQVAAWMTAQTHSTVNCYVERAPSHPSLTLLPEDVVSGTRARGIQRQYCCHLTTKRRAS